MNLEKLLGEFQKIFNGREEENNNKDITNAIVVADKEIPAVINNSDLNLNLNLNLNLTKQSKKEIKNVNNEDELDDLLKLREEINMVGDGNCSVYALMSQLYPEIYGGTD
jgi:hypothetical protein